MNELPIPALQYTELSELPFALGKLGEQELTSVIEARLRGDNAGLPAPQQQEDPSDVLIYAFRQGEPALKEKFKVALNLLLEKQFRAFVLSQAVNGNQDLLERLFFLIGFSGSREALPTIRKFLPFFELTRSQLIQRLVGCIASLADASDSALIPWLLERADDPQQCRIALKALFNIHRPTAAAALPRVAVSLQRKGEAEPSFLLARSLVLMLPGLSEPEQVQFLRQAGESLRATASAAKDVILSALSQTPGIAPRVLRTTRTWKLEPITDVPHSYAVRLKGSKKRFSKQEEIRDSISSFIQPGTSSKKAFSKQEEIRRGREKTSGPEAR